MIFLQWDTASNVIPSLGSINSYIYICCINGNIVSTGGKIRDLTGRKFGKLTVTSFNSLNNHRVFWNCICDCNNSTIISSGNLLTKKTKSCGCLRTKNLSHKSNKDRTGFTILYRSYKTQAKRRGYEFLLSEDEAHEFFQKRCFYCNDLPSNVSIQKEVKNKSIIRESHYIYNGIDRIDNNVGYNFTNCVPCCKICNKMKSNYNLNDFYNHIEKILRVKNERA